MNTYVFYYRGRMHALTLTETAKLVGKTTTTIRMRYKKHGDAQKAIDDPVNPGNRTGTMERGRMLTSKEVGVSKLMRW